MTASSPPATKVALPTVDLILSLSKGEGVSPSLHSLDPVLRQAQDEVFWSAGGSL